MTINDLTQDVIKMEERRGENQFCQLIQIQILDGFCVSGGSEPGRFLSSAGFAPASQHLRAGLTGLVLNTHRVMSVSIVTSRHCKPHWVMLLTTTRALSSLLYTAPSWSTNPQLKKPIREGPLGARAVPTSPVPSRPSWGHNVHPWGVCKGPKRWLPHTPSRGTKAALGA